MEQFTNTEELLRRMRENVPEILGGESNPDMEDEVEQIMCVVESAPRVAPEGVRPVAHIAWRKRPKQFVVYDPVPTNECLYDGKPVYTQRVLKLEENTQCRFVLTAITVWTIAPGVFAQCAVRL